MTDSEVIDRLGGNAAVMEFCGVQHTAIITNWRTRGIAWPARAKVAEMAKAKGIDLPSDFLTHRRKPQAQDAA
jgi:hypothetical protein